MVPVDNAPGLGSIFRRMAKPLVIVESPAKARTIEGFLGGEFTVLASMGHIRDLPAKGLSVDVDNDFKVEYEVHASKKDMIAELKKALKDADELYLATDEDREGEAISWHLLEVLKPTVPVKRMVFHEITQARHRARHRREPRRRLRPRRRPGEPPHRRPPLRLPGVGGAAGARSARACRPAGCSRRACASSSSGSASAWRSSPPATGTSAPRSPPSRRSPRRSHAIDGHRVAGSRDFDCLRASQARRRRRARRGRRPAPQGRARRPAVRRSPASRPSRTRRSPKPPFITSTLQQVGGCRLRMSSRQVMSLAQGLYEDGYITYMRTDSTTLSDTAISAARQVIERQFGREYLTDAPAHLRQEERRTPRRPTRPSGPPATRLRTPDAAPRPSSAATSSASTS